MKLIFKLEHVKWKISSKLVRLEIGFNVYTERKVDRFAKFIRKCNFNFQRFSKNQSVDRENH